MNKYAIITNAHGESFKKLSMFTNAYNSRYANSIGVDFLAFSEAPEDRHPAWAKITLCERALKMGYEWICWIDADAIFLSKKNIFDLKDEKYFFICQGETHENGFNNTKFCESFPQELKSGLLNFKSSEPPFCLNSGLFLLKNTEESFTFLKKVYSETVGGVLLWGRWGWEQMAIEILLRGNPEWKDKIKLYKYGKIWSIPWDIEKYLQVFAVHINGKIPLIRKLRELKSASLSFEASDSLSEV
jgi:hypothetical protein